MTTQPLSRSAASLPNLRYILLMGIFLAAVLFAAFPGTAQAEPIDVNRWQKISTASLETELGSDGAINSIVEYDGKIYAGGIAKPTGSTDFTAVVYSGNTLGQWDLVSPDFGAGDDSQVTHMTVFDSKLYVAIKQFDGLGPLKIWLYDSATDSWTEDSKFTLNAARVSDYITQVIGMGVSSNGKLCANTVDMQVVDLNMTLICTDGLTDWTALPSTGITSTEFTSVINHNLSMYGQTAMIAANDDLGDGDVSTSFWIYEDIDDPSGTWQRLNANTIGNNRVVTAFNANIGGVILLTADFGSNENVELWQYVDFGGGWVDYSTLLPLPVPNISAAYIIGLQQLEDSSTRFMFSGVSNNSPVLMELGTSSWTNSTPTASQIGQASDNPSSIISSLGSVANNDVYIGLKGSSTFSGNGSIWWYENSPDDIIVDPPDGVSGDNSQPPNSGANNQSNTADPENQSNSTNNPSLANTGTNTTPVVLVAGLIALISLVISRRIFIQE